MPKTKRIKQLTLIFLYTYLLIYTQCFYSQPKTPFQAPNAMVVSARAEASKIGKEILQKGGNAFDAMVATELALAVAYPQAGNIGGGGFMVFRKNNGEIGALDYREKAPLTANKNMFLDSNNNVIPNKSTESAMAVGIPGTIAGIFEVNRKFGSMKMSELIQPAIDLAKKGFVLTPSDIENLNEYRQTFIKINGKDALFSQKYKVNDRIRPLALAKTLEIIAQKGESAFYEGEIAKTLINYLNQKGGNFSIDDFKNYKAIWRKPITFDYKDLHIISMSPPSSGGICLNQIMKMIEPFDLKKSKHNTPETIQILTEAERRAYADRNHFLGDPDFVDIPTNSLLDEKYLKERMSTFNPLQATPSDKIEHGIFFKESTQTTHYSIVDSFGNAVSVTTTLNDNFGSKHYCETLGFFLNNQMDDFSSKPGVPNLYGLTGSEANSIAPKKRMLSSMTPTIVEKNGKLWMVVGSPGGSTIITTVLQTILNVYEFGMNMQEAVDAPRFHHQWLPDEIIMEPNSFSKNTINNLRKKKYNIEEKNNEIIGQVDAILVLSNGYYQAGADKRGDNTADGF